MYVLLDSKLIKCEEVLSRFKMLTTHTHTQPNTADIQTRTQR